MVKATNFHQIVTQNQLLLLNIFRDAHLAFKHAPVYRAAGTLIAHALFEADARPRNLPCQNSPHWCL